MNTAYDVLGVPRSAGDEAIKAAFYKTAKACHPDLHAGDRAAEQQLKQAIAAYHILKSPQRRETYDQYLKDCRREKVRRFAAPVVAGLMSGSGVALAVWLSFSPSRTPVAFGPQAPGIAAAAMVSQPADQRVAATTDNGGVRQGTADGHADDRGVAPPDRRLPGQTASLHPIAVPLETPLAEEWEQVQATGDPRAIWAFAVRNPDAPESELARTKLTALIDAAEDVSLLRVLRLVGTDEVAERAQERLIRLGALPADRTDSLVADAPSSRSLLRASVGEAIEAVNRPPVAEEESVASSAPASDPPSQASAGERIEAVDREQPAAQKTRERPRAAAKRPAINRTPPRQVASENRSTAAASAPGYASPPLFGVGF
jgi:curved DNA-binding protein CbpA